MGTHTVFDCLCNGDGLRFVESQRGNRAQIRRVSARRDDSMVQSGSSASTSLSSYLGLVQLLWGDFAVRETGT